MSVLFGVLCSFLFGEGDDPYFIEKYGKNAAFRTDLIESYDGGWLVCEEEIYNSNLDFQASLSKYDVNGEHLWSAYVTPDITRIS